MDGNVNRINFSDEVRDSFLSLPVEEVRIIDNYNVMG